MTYAECKTITDQILVDLVEPLHTEGHHKDMQDSIIKLTTGLADANERLNVLEIV